MDESATPNWRFFKRKCVLSLQLLTANNKSSIHNSFLGTRKLYSKITVVATRA